MTISIEQPKPSRFTTSRSGQFMASTIGRVTRIVAGMLLIGGGLLVVGGIPGMVLAAIGLVPLLAGSFDVCVISKFFRGPFSGAEIRACAND